MHGSSSMHECTICGRELKTRGGLIAHMEAKHGRGNTYQATQAWEDMRNQSGAITVSGAGGSYNYEITQARANKSQARRRAPTHTLSFHRRVRVSTAGYVRRLPKRVGVLVVRSRLQEEEVS